PFQNLSGDVSGQSLADGMTADVIAGLARQQWCSVAARRDSFALRNTSVDIREAASRLNVRYVLEGSARNAAGWLRVTAQLVDAARRVHVWADHYDSVFSHGVGRQDDITRSIVDAVNTQVIMAEAARLRRQVPPNPDARGLVLQALPHMWRMSAEEQERAQALLRQAAALDDEDVHPHV